MPEVVSCNTSPLQYLHQLGHLALLPAFHHTVVSPPSVAQELAQGRALGVAVPDPATLPWLQIRTPRPLREVLRTSPLGRGERDVLALALETPAALVLMDDGQARRLGQHLGLRLTGTVGVLARATREGRIPRLAPLLDRLAVLGFRLSPQARAMALTLVGEPEGHG